MKKTERLISNYLYLIFEILKTIVLSVVPLSFYPKKCVKNEVVLITGGANGLGREMAIRFAKLGARLVIWDVDKPGSDVTCRLVQQAGGRIDAYHVDVSDRKAVYETAAKVKREVGKVDILVNSAGIAYCKTLMELKDVEIQRVFDVNALANFWVTKAFLPEIMEENHGHIVTMSSISGCIGSDLIIDYSSSKHAANGFMESLAVHMAANGCDKVYTTNCCTYIIDTEMFKIHYDGIVPMMKIDYAVDQMMTAVLTNTEMFYLPKALNVLLLFRSILSARAVYYLQNMFSDRNAAKTAQMRKLPILNGVSDIKSHDM